LGSLSLNKIQNCEVQKKENLKKIKNLESLIRINPFLLNNLYLRKDKKILEKILYLFLKYYNSFKYLQMT
jgi:hypothetical protein